MKAPGRRLLVVTVLAVGWGAFTAYRIWQAVINPPAVKVSAGSLVPYTLVFASAVTVSDAGVIDRFAPV